MFYNYFIKIGRKKVSLYTYRASKVTLLSTSPMLILNFKSRLHVLLNTEHLARLGRVLRFEEMLIRFVS